MYSKEHIEYLQPPTLSIGPYYGTLQLHSRMYKSSKISQPLIFCIGEKIVYVIDIIRNKEKIKHDHWVLYVITTKNNFKRYLSLFIYRCIVKKSPYLQTCTAIFNLEMFNPFIMTQKFVTEKLIYKGRPLNRPASVKVTDHKTSRTLTQPFILFLSLHMQPPSLYHYLSLCAPRTHPSH